MIKVFQDGDVEEAKETIRECLRASRTVRKGRDAGGHIIYEEVADYPIRLTAGIKILEWAIGKPINRTVTANLTPPGNDEAASKPSLADLVMANAQQTANILSKLLDEAQRSKDGQPFEVNVTPQLVQSERPST